MKKFILSVLLIWGIQAIAIAQDYENIPEYLKNSFLYEGIRYHRLSDSTVEVGYHLADYRFTEETEEENRILLWGDIVIPSTVSDAEREYTVVAIGSQAFSGNQCTSVTLPATIKTIGKESFRGCDKLIRISLPDGMESIGEYAFYGCKFTEINIPKTVTYMANWAFSFCFELEEITLPPNINIINEGIFYCCEKLRHINIPDKVTTIMSNAFSDCDSLKHIDLPSGITSIESSAFEGCTYLKEAVLPPGLEKIGERAFYNCYRLQDIYFPSSLRYIGDEAFGIYQKAKSYRDYCACNKNYHFSDDGNVPLEIGKRAFENQLADSIVLPKNVYKIGEEAFYECRSKYLYIPNGIHEIEHKAFYFGRVEIVVSYLEDLSVYKSESSPTLFPHTLTLWRKVYVPNYLLDIYKNNVEWQDFIIIPMENGVITGTGNMSIERSGDTTARYDLSGRRIDSPMRGINIIETSSGRHRKVMVK